MSNPFSLSGRTTAFKGAMLSVGMRWSDRLMGFVSTLVLARLLVPADFGLVAMAMVVVGLLDVLLDLGVAAALIQRGSTDREDFDTAWSLRLCQTFVAATLIVLCAPLAADYFSDPRIVNVMRVIAVTILVGGLENIGVVRFQKDMEFGREFKFLVSKKAIGVAATLLAALLLRSYWALVLGSMATRLGGVVLSYGMSSFRPRWSLSRLAGIWSFSQWNLVMRVGEYAGARFDRVMVGRRADASVVGAYAVGEELATLPTSEVLAPMGRVMFPAFADARHDPVEFQRIVKLSIAVSALMGIPAGVGVALVAAEAIPLLLGMQWGAAVPIMQLIGLASVATTLAQSSHYALLATGRIRGLAFCYWAQFLALVTVVVVAFPAAGARGIAVARVAVAFAAMLGMQLLARWAFPWLGARTFLGQIWRPVIAVAAMATVVLAIPTTFAGGQLIVLLAAKIIAGALTYCAAVVLVWRAVGCPESGESYIIEKAGLKKLAAKVLRAG